MGDTDIYTGVKFELTSKIFRIYMKLISFTHTYTLYKTHDHSLIHVHSHKQRIFVQHFNNTDNLTENSPETPFSN